MKAKLAEGDAEEQERVDYRADEGRGDRRFPPGQLSHAVEYRHVQQLRDQERGSGGDGNAGRRQPDRQHHGNQEAGNHNLARGGRSEAAVGEIGHQEGDRVGERTPGERIGKIDTADEMLDRELDQKVGCNDNSRHRQNGDYVMARGEGPGFGHVFTS